MPGNTEWLLMLLHILLYGLSVCYGCMNDETPITIPLSDYQNGTGIPEKYKNLRVVGKCCPMGQIFNGTADKCVVSDVICKYSFSPLFHTLNNKPINQLSDKPTEEFVAIIGIPCKCKKTTLDPDDKNILWRNGSVFAPNEDPTMLKLGVHYCMENLTRDGLKIFMCLPDKDPSVVAADSRYTVYACCFLISVPFLILTIAAYCITPQLRDGCGKALCCYCACLALAFSMLAIMQLRSSQLSDEAYTSIAFVIQFSFIASFFWMNATFIAMWLSVPGETVKRMEPETLFICYSLWCWSLSMIHIYISVKEDLGPTIPISYVKPNCGEEEICPFANQCQPFRNKVFSTSRKALIFFYVPVGLLFLGNVILFVLTFIKISKYQEILDSRRLKENEESVCRDRKLVRCYTRTAIACLIIFSLMALNWSIELLGFLLVDGDIDGGVPVRQWSIYDLVNTLQGVVVFYLFVIRRPQKDLVWHRIQQLRGIETTPPQVGNTELSMLNSNTTNEVQDVGGDTVPGQTITP